MTISWMEGMDFNDAYLDKLPEHKDKTERILSLD
jgi:hypothetical protein